MTYDFEREKNIEEDIEATESGEEAQELKFSLEEALAEVERLRTLKEQGPLSQYNEGVLSILTQWLGHYTLNHVKESKPSGD